MATLIVMVVVLLVVCRVSGACLRLTDRSLPRGRQAREAWLREKRAASLASPVPPAAAAPETPLESLQRRFAEGQITMEQYERDVDRLLGVRSTN